MLSTMFDGSIFFLIIQIISVLALLVLLALMTKTDIEEFLLPDKYTLSAAVLGFGLSILAPLPGMDALSSGIGAAVGPAFLLCVRWYVGWRTGRGGDEALGLGDVKFAAAAGAWVGWQGLAWFMLLGAVLGLFLALAAFLARRGTEDESFDLIPFGPALCLALAILVLSSLLGHPFGPLGPPALSEYLGIHV